MTAGGPANRLRDVREVTVASVQMECRNFDVGGNLRRAEGFIEQAAQAGAELVLLPEFMPCGYLYDEAAWQAAEPAGGITDTWLIEKARRHNLLIGTSYLEARGEHFYNRFSLAGPDGILGAVCKQDVAYFENFFNAAEVGPHCIDTVLGRIGVGICYENTRAFLSQRLVEADVDLVLQPHSTPALPRSTPGFVQRSYARTMRTAAAYARSLGLPVVHANKVGPFVSPRPIFPGGRYRSWFIGGSSIYDSDGQARAAAPDGAGEEVLVATVTLDAARKTHRPLPAVGKWIESGSPMSHWWLEQIAKRGRRSYLRNPRRAAAARAVTRGSRAASE